MQMREVQNKQGFTLIEAIIAIALFTLFVMGIYGGIQLVLKVVYSSRIRILETAILNEQMETIRNMSFYDVGIINGSPAGLLDRDITVTRNGIDFDITRTIRNIDDPYDGTVDGDPQDLAPADYKLVAVEVICDGCGQNQVLSMQTYIAPKFLEGDPTHGALFIEVFDAQAQPVSGAIVHIVSTSTDPTYDFYDTTDNDGMLRLVDMAEGIGEYHITVTKVGYTTDQTVASSEAQSNPIKPPASVVAQDVTEISFSIDNVSTIDVATINNLCQVVSSVPFTIRGTKLSGTNPEQYKVDASYTTDGSGNYTLTNMLWDSYSFGISSFDFMGTIPDVPVLLNPNVIQPLQLIVGPNTPHSLLVIVTDNDQPIANATVTVSSTDLGYSYTDVTGVGSISQTDWSGGLGQVEFSDTTRYFTDSGGVDVLNSSGNVTLLNTGSFYVNNATLESSIIDLGLSPEYVLLSWSPLSQPAETGVDSVKFQIATSASSTPTSWEYFGPDGTTSTYYTADTQTIADIHDGDRYARYKLFMQTADTDVTPTLSDVTLLYTNSCTPPGQMFVGGLSEATYSVTVEADGYQTQTIEAPVSGNFVVSVELAAQ